MKNLVILVLSIVTVGMTSCKKEEVKPVATPSSTSSTVPAAQREITVKYVVYAVSGDFKMNVLVPINGELKQETYIINRLTQEIEFDFKSGNKFMVEAINTNPSTDEVIVEIYIDGKLSKSASANTPNTYAKVEKYVNN